MKNVFMAMALMINIASCKNSELEQQLLATQKQLVETEQKLLETTNENRAKLDLVKLYLEVGETIVHSKGDKYTIRVDETKNGQLRYASWKSPKTSMEIPDVVVYDGKMEKTKTQGVCKYKFSLDANTYIVETVPVKRGSRDNHIFLEILEAESQKHYGKMVDISSQM